MSTVITRTRHTPEHLLSMPDAARYELVDGQLVERHMGAKASYIGARLCRMIGNFCEDHRSGWCLGADCGYRCFPDPNKVRRADVSFIRFGRFAGEQVPEGHMAIAPDLAVEVLSPNDLDDETDQKVEEYLAAGVSLVWIVNPETRTILIYRANGSISGLREQDELSGEDVLPGFRCRVADIFRLPAGAEAAAAKTS